MRIAILGATSQIARDLIVSFSTLSDERLHLFARRPQEVSRWMDLHGLTDRHSVMLLSDFGRQAFDAVINFVGAGDPARIADAGYSIFDTTLHFDDKVLEYLRAYPSCRYLFLSSGAAYGSNFSEPAGRDSVAVVPINNLAPRDWYGVAKLHAECRHRAHPDLCIFDIRVFNYFSRSQDINARFLISDMLRAIRDKVVLKTSPEYIVRDFLHPADFHSLVSALLSAPIANASVDCYTCAPIDKPSLLAAMQERFGLRYEIVDASAGINATGSKPHYYSMNTRAADFGYQPKLTSLEGILKDAESLLSGLSAEPPPAI